MYGRVIRYGNGVNRSHHKIDSNNEYDRDGRMDNQTVLQSINLTRFDCSSEQCRSFAINIGNGQNDF